MLRRVLIIFTFLMAILFSLKYYTAERAHRFIMECLTEEEISIIMDDSGDRDAQDQIVNKRWPCVFQRQSWVERIVLRAYGPGIFD
ncbi:hypothetical protein DNK49_06395 [Azoarcus communis]|uniref:Uncharacterized protein n=1 Tax=Parazoarcus communis SWub3 = DSM 12120 TaxID=1121029 RepID=A0A323V1X2_9RHOO|nr:hypothetical protein DNK49_06395 [Azoarcus communis] [Parazoarcus communis SWub3 = DSM 12120]